MEVKFQTNRILVAHFAGNPGTTVIAQYSPVEGNARAEDSFNSLTSAIKEVPKYNILW